MVSGEIKYAEYVEYQSKRQSANTAINALLAGSKLASHTLRLTEGSERTLAEIFPAVDRVGVFNLRSGVARQVLTSAEEHLGVMAVPYLLAIHEDYLKETLTLLHGAGLIAKVPDKLAHMHKPFKTVTSKATLQSDALELIDLIRIMRNAVIHRGGLSDQYLETTCNNLSATARQTWQKMTTQQAPQYSAGDSVVLGYSEIVATLAVTKRLARDVNNVMGHAYPRALWLDKLLDEYRTHTPQPAKRQRVIEGIANFQYAPLNFTTAELSAARAAAGI